jgi:NAD(P)-dependent dehydrogenase (short-subunit alcohol dehydrogenase family)
MRTVLVTGANGNLGTSVVENLHAKGFQVCATVGSGPLPENFTTWTQDVQKVNLTDETAVRTYVETLTAKYPDLDSAVLLVGGFIAGNLRETDEAAIDQQVKLNFKTAFFTIKPLLDHFEKRGGGRFILIGARPAIAASAGKDLVAYSVSKAMVMHLAELINATGKNRRITATVLVPSTIDTEANRKSMPDADFSKWVNPKDIAETISFVLSDSAKILRETVIKVYNEA